MPRNKSPTFVQATTDEKKRASQVVEAGRALGCARNPLEPGCDLSRFGINLAELKKAMDEPTVTNLLSPTDAPNSSSMSEIAVVSVCYPEGDAQNTDVWAKICDIARTNFKAYCRKHGYRLFFHDSQPDGLAGRETTWAKILAVKSALREPGVQLSL